MLYYLRRKSVVLSNSFSFLEKIMKYRPNNDGITNGGGGGGFVKGDEGSSCVTSDCDKDHCPHSSGKKRS